jgi:hypothetical protein
MPKSTANYSRSLHKDCDKVPDLYLAARRNRIQRRRGGGKANIALARKFLGVIYHTLKNNWVFEDFPNFVLAS